MNILKKISTHTRSAKASQTSRKAEHENLEQILRRCLTSAEFHWSSSAQKEIEGSRGKVAQDHLIFLSPWSS